MSSTSESPATEPPMFAPAPPWGIPAWLDPTASLISPLGRNRMTPYPSEILQMIFASDSPGGVAGKIVPRPPPPEIANLLYQIFALPPHQRVDIRNQQFGGLWGDLLNILQSRFKELAAATAATAATTGVASTVALPPLPSPPPLSTGKPGKGSKTKGSQSTPKRGKKLLKSEVTEDSVARWKDYRDFKRRSVKPAVFRLFYDLCGLSLPPLPPPPPPERKTVDYSWEHYEVFMANPAAVPNYALWGMVPPAGLEPWVPPPGMTIEQPASTSAIVPSLNPSLDGTPSGATPQSVQLRRRQRAARPAKSPRPVSPPAPLPSYHSTIPILYDPAPPFGGGHLHFGSPAKRDPARNVEYLLGSPRKRPHEEAEEQKVHQRTAHWVAKCPRLHKNYSTPARSVFTFERERAASELPTPREQWVDAGPSRRPSDVPPPHSHLLHPIPRHARPYPPALLATRSPSPADPSAAPTSVYSWGPMSPPAWSPPSPQLPMELDPPSQSRSPATPPTLSFDLNVGPLMVEQVLLARKEWTNAMDQDEKELQARKHEVTMLEKEVANRKHQVSNDLVRKNSVRPCMQRTQAIRAAELQNKEKELQQREREVEIAREDVASFRRREDRRVVEMAATHDRDTNRLEEEWKEFQRNKQHHARQVNRDHAELNKLWEAIKQHEKIVMQREKAVHYQEKAVQKQKEAVAEHRASIAASKWANGDRNLGDAEEEEVDELADDD